jgi:hypothetical protein
MLLTDIQTVNELQMLSDNFYDSPTHAGIEIDRQIAAAATCSFCRGPVDYRPVFNAGSYRAFLICHACDTAEEF